MLDKVIATGLTLIAQHSDDKSSFCPKSAGVSAIDGRRSSH
jgi:hypothetical protein